MPTETPPNGSLDDLFAERDRAMAEREAEAPAESNGPVDLSTIQGAAGLGVASAILETKDFLFGEPEESAKSDVRRMIESLREDVRGSDDVLPNLAMGVSQFVTGFLGAGKLTAPIKSVQKLRTGTTFQRLAEGEARAAAVGAIAFDPHEERLSNFLVEFPQLDGPVTRYLAASPDDTAAEGRLKAGLESIGVSAAIAGPFIVGAKVLKHMRSRKAGSPELEADLVKSARINEADEAPAPRPGETIGGETFDQSLARLEREVTSPPPVSARGPVLPVPNTIEDALKDIATAAPRIRMFPGGGAEPLVAGNLNDADVLMRHGSRHAAAQAGEAIGADKLPWQKIQTPEALEAFVERVAKATESQIQMRRGGTGPEGVMTDAHVQRLVAMRTGLWGERPEDVYGQIVAAGRGAKQMVADRLAAEGLAVKAMDEAYEVSAKLGIGNLDQWGGDRGAALCELVGRVSVATELLAADRAMASGAGRTLRTLREDASTRLTHANIRKLASLSPERLAKILENTGGDIHAIKFALERPGLLARAVDQANYLLVNNLLWGATTHAVNASTTLYMMASRPLERIAGSYGLRLTGKLGGSDASAMRTQAVREYRYMLGSIADSARIAGRVFARGDSIIDPHTAHEALEAGSRAFSSKALTFRPIEDVHDLAANAVSAYKATVGFPTRTLGVVDEFTRQMRYRGMVMAEASMEADKRGLKGEAYRAFVRQRLSKSFNERGEGTDARALEEARRVNFQQDLTHRLDTPGSPVTSFGDSPTAGQLLQSTFSRAPLLRQIVPFLRTPVNVVRYGVKLTPGLNLLQTRYRHAVTGKLGAEAQAHAVGQMSLGTLFTATVGMYAHLGMFTGSGPNEHRVKRDMASAGWKPNSFVIPRDDEGYDYHHLGRFDPIGLPAGIAADALAILDYATQADDASLAQRAEAIIGGLGLAMWEQVRERSYVRTFVRFLDALDDPKAFGPAFARQHVQNLVPFSSAFRNYGGEAMQYMREVRSVTDALLATLPGFAENVPLRRNALGEPIRIRRAPWSNVNDDVVDQELIRMGLEGPEGFGIGHPSPRDHGVDLRDVALEDGSNAFEKLQEYSRQPSAGIMSLRDALATVIQRPEYQAATDGAADTRGTKQWLLARVTRQYREAAKKRLRAENPMLRARLREAEVTARAAFEASRSRGPDAGQQQFMRDLANQYGIPIGQ